MNDHLLYNGRMQLSIKVQKWLIPLLVVMSASLLMTWNTPFVIPNISYAPSDHTSYYLPTDHTSYVPSNAINLLPDESIWDNLRNNFQLDLHSDTPRVRAEIRKLLADKAELNRVLAAAGPYIYFIYEQVQEKGLPAELALIPLIESEFNPKDHSKVGATGLWQLMPGTAKDLGVKVKSGYDGRRNVINSTKAALKFFKELGDYFHGNWFLAIAAYNCGPGRVHSAVHHSGTTNYWDLKLPLETKLYVPKLLAVAAIIKNPNKYGIKLPTIDNKPYISAVKLKKPVSLYKISTKTTVDIKTLDKLNPDYGDEVAKDILLVPASKVSEVKESFIESVES